MPDLHPELQVRRYQVKSDPAGMIGPLRDNPEAIRVGILRARMF